MPIQIPVTQTGLEASIEAAAKKAGKSLKINMGGGAKGIEGLSQPLGRITGKADQFTKSMEAANARVLAFGASVGVLSAVTRGFKELVTTTIEVEKSLTSINSILGTTTAQLNTFKKEIFDVARNTEQSFATVATAALELSRQGLKAEEVTKRLNDSLVLARLSGLGASEAVAGLTAAINSFNRTGITSGEVLNKLSAAAVSAAVSERDLIEGVKRSGSVAIQAGVSFNELVGVITAVQAKTARGGAVIGNSFKTIFTRIQSIDKLKTMQNLGMDVTDASGEILSATQLIRNLSVALTDLPDARKLQIAEKLVGKFQIAPFLAILDDYNQKTSVAIKVTEIAANATTEAYTRNVALNKTMAAAINEASVNLKELATTLGEIGVTDSLKNILTFFNSLVGKIQQTLEGEGLGGDFARGIVKGIGNILSGPGLAIFAAVIAKLTIDLAKFGVGSLQTFFGLNRAAKDQAALQGQIASTLLNNSSIQKQIMKIENSTLSIEQKRAAQTKFFTIALNEQLAVMQRMQMIAGRVAPGVMAGTRRGAGGYIPNFNASVGYGSERGDINRGVGGAPRSAKPVTIPNFNFGGGQKGTMVANNSEYMVPNFAGSGGSAIFNQNMVNSMGLPANAKRVGAAGGYIPNFNVPKKGRAVPKPIFDSRFGMIVPRRGLGSLQQTAKADNGTTYKWNVYGIDAAGEKARETPRMKEDVRKFAIKEAIDEAGFITGGKPRKANIEKLGNEGSVGSLAGSIFETALSALIKSPDFDAFNQTARFDYVGPSAVKSISDISPGLRNSPVTFLEAKIRENDSGIKKSMANKIAFAIGKTAGGGITKSYGQQLRAPYKVKGKGTHEFKYQTEEVQRRLGGIRIRNSGAKGYIPNFASPLHDAVEREAAAGLPINQIRINQDASLRGAANPMGLAVTNMRDEPTGSIAARGYIPNFKKGDPSGAGGGFSNMVSSMLGLQIAFSMLTPVLGEVSDQNKIVTGTMKALNYAMIAMIAVQTLGGLKIGGMLKGMAGTVVGKGAWATKGKALQSLGTSSQLAGRNAQRAGLHRMRNPNMYGSMRPTGKGWGIARGGKYGKLGSSAGGARMMMGGVGKGFMGGLAKAGGALLRFAGPIGLAAGAALFLNKKFNDWTGTTDALKTAEQQLASATKIAAKELNQLEVPESFKAYMTEGAEETASELTEDLRKGKRGDLTGTKDSARWKAFEGLLAKALSSGASRRDVLGRINEFEQKAVTVAGEKLVGWAGPGGGGVSKVQIKGGEARDFTNKEFAEMNTYLKQVVNNTDADRRVRGLFADMSMKELETMESVLNYEADIKRRGSTLQKDQESGAGSDYGDKLKERRDFHTSMRKKAFSAGGPANLSGEVVIKSMEIAGMRELNKQREEANALDEKNSKLTRIATEEYQERLRHAIAMENISNNEVDNLTEQLLIAEKLGGLTGEEISALKIKKIEAQQSVSNNAKILKTIEGISKFTKNVNVDREKEKILLKSIEEAKEDGKITDEERKDLIKKVHDLNQDTTGELKNQLTAKINLLTEEEKALDKATQILILQEKITEQARQQAGFRGAAGGGAEGRDAAWKFEKEGEFQKTIDREKALQDQLRGNVRPTAVAGEALERALAASNVRSLAAEQGKSRLNLQEGARGRAAGLMDQVSNFERFAGQVQGIEGGAVSGRELVEGRSPAETAEILRAFGKELEKLTDQPMRALGVKMNNMANQIDNDVAAAKKGEEADIAAAEAALKFAGVLKLASQGELFGEMKRSLLVGREQSLLDARLETDSFARIKANMANNNYQRKQDASTPEAYRSILEEEQFAAQLVDASATFASNIGNAMVDAIAKGEDLGDALRGAAADFFLMLSKAFMQKAVNNMAGLGTEGGGTGIIGGFVNFITGGLNAGGMVRGGSGNRDDVPSLLTGGEFVMQKGAVQKYGPDFMSALNTGRIQGMQRGGLYRPGTYGQGAISGKEDLFNYATQGFTMGQHDKIMSGPNVGSASLEPHSVRMTRWGIKNSRMAQTESAAQQESLGLYFQQLDKEKQEKEQAKARKDALKAAFISMVASAAISGATGGFKKGGNTGTGGAGAGSGVGLGVGLGGGSGGGQSSWWSRTVGRFFGGSGGATQPPRYGWGSSGAATMDGGNPLLPELPRWRNRAAGGAVPHAAGIDTVPTMLSGGEFVMNAAATQNIGRGNLASMNSGSGGGGNQDVVGRLDELIDVSEGSGETVINITVNSDGTTTQDETNAQEQQQSLAMKIKDQVRLVIDEEKRLGGSLRQARA